MATHSSGRLLQLLAAVNAVVVVSAGVVAPPLPPTRVVNTLDVVVNVSLLAEDTSSGSRDLQHFAFGTLGPGNFTGYHSLKALE